MFTHTEGAGATTALPEKSFMDVSILKSSYSQEYPCRTAMSRQCPDSIKGIV